MTRPNHRLHDYYTEIRAKWFEKKLAKPIEISDRIWGKYTTMPIAKAR